MSVLRATFFAAGLALVALMQSEEVRSQGAAFRLEEATIADVHRAIQQGQLTCAGSCRPTSIGRGPITASAIAW